MRDQSNIVQLVGFDDRKLELVRKKYLFYIAELKLILIIIVVFIASLNTEKAFDKTWRERIILKLLDKLVAAMWRVLCHLYIIFILIY